MDPNFKLHSKLNKHIDIKIPRKKGIAGLFQSGKQQVFRVPPLNAVIDSGFGQPPPKQSKAFRGFQSGTNVDHTQDIQFLNWASIRKDTFDDPNKYRSQKLKNFQLLKPINQDCCGACWAVSTTMAFADRHGIANDTKPINPSIISVMSCCTKLKHRNVFKLVDTPDCDIMSTYEELETSNNSMGMCSGGIPYSAGLTIYRNGLPDDSKTTYTPSLFKCDQVPSFPNMNQALIQKYPCEQNLFDTKKIKMDQDEKPTYISSSEGPPQHYVELMKKALLEGGPLVGGYLVLGDNLALGTDGSILGQTGKEEQMFNWDSTGKVYVPKAYNQEWSNVMVSGVGGSGTVDIDDTNPDEPSKIYDQGLKARSAIGNIFCGFHAIVIVGWGELDMEYVSNKNVKTVKGKDGRDKLPFWICRNSWGDVWPLEDYYKGGIKVRHGDKEETLEIPPGFWLHAMYPNESMGLDVPVNYEGTYYGATMVMTPSKDQSDQPKVKDLGEKRDIVSVGEACNTNWTDSEGYNCRQYGEYNWCTQDGQKGDGWDDQWGDFRDFSNRGYDATEICCECGSSNEIQLQETEVEEETKTAISIGGVMLLLLCIGIFAILASMLQQK